MTIRMNSGGDLLAVLSKGAAYATLHNGVWQKNEDGYLIEDEVIPEVARTTDIRDLTVTFNDIPENCYAQHMALWDKDDRLLCRSTIFHDPQFPEWSISRPLTKGSKVEVVINPVLAPEGVLPR